MFQEEVPADPANRTSINWNEKDFIHKCTLEFKSFDDLYHNRSRFLRFTTVCESSPLTKKYFTSIFTTEQEINRHINGPQWYIIHPLSKFVIVWERIMLIVFIINWYVVLFQIANFGYLTSTSKVINFAIQCPCYADIIIRFFTGFKTKFDIHLNHRMIVMNYLKSTFVFDLIASVPFQVVEDLLSNHLRRVTLYIVIMYQALKIVTFNRIRTYFKECFDIWNYHYVLYMVLSLTLYSLLCYHFTACFYQSCANLIQMKYPDNLHPLNNLTNIEKFPRLGKFWYRNLYCLYLVALKFYCFTFVNGKFYEEQSILEIVNSSIIIIAAYFYQLYLLVKVIQIFQFRHSSKIKYQEIMNQLEQYMRTKRLPLTIKKSLIQFYQQRYQYRFFKEKSIEENLSESLRRELIFHCGKLFINRVGIFENIPKTSLFNIISCLKPEIYMPNDLITKAGTVGECMYFIASGTVSIRATTGQELLHLEDGDHFGEVSLFSKHGRRVSNSIAIEYCELYRLDKSDYETYIGTIPELADKFETLAMQRMNATITVEESFKNEHLKSKISINDDDDDDNDDNNFNHNQSAASSSSNLNI